MEDFISASAASKISKQNAAVRIAPELETLNKSIRDAAEQGYTSLQVKKMSHQAQAFLLSKKFKVSHHSDIRQPEDDHYTISWAK